MSGIALLKRYIREQIEMTQAVVKTDDDNDKVIRKLVKFKKNGSRFRMGDKVEADIDPKTGNIIVDDVEMWIPDFDGKH